MRGGSCPRAGVFGFSSMPGPGNPAGSKQIVSAPAWAPASTDSGVSAYRMMPMARSGDSRVSGARERLTVCTINVARRSVLPLSPCWQGTGRCDQGLLGTGEKFPPYLVNLTDRRKQGAVITEGRGWRYQMAFPRSFRSCAASCSSVSGLVRAGARRRSPSLFHGDRSFTRWIDRPCEREKSFRGDLRHHTDRHRVAQVRIFPFGRSAGRGPQAPDRRCQADPRPFSTGWGTTSTISRRFTIRFSC